MTNGLLPPLKPLPIKERLSVVFVERGEIDMLDGAFVVVDAGGVRTHIPVGGVACIMLEPGTRVSHRAAALPVAGEAVRRAVERARLRRRGLGRE